MDESRHLINYLQLLRPAGPEGFEGLVAQLLERLTGQRFFLAHAGSQDGRDMSTSGFGSTWIAVEAKRFKTGERFERRDLLGELVELPGGIDLWVLASTARVSDQLISALRKEAASRGIAVDTLDAPLDRLGDLPVLCAAHEDVVLPFLTEIGAGADLGQILEAIRRHPDYTSTLEKLRDRFRAGSIGYAQARDASLSYLRSAFEDASRARVELGQPINVLENEGRHVVERSQVLEALDAWWREWPTVSKPFVLLGEEGMGKTWAIASWLARQLAIPDSLPLTLFLPSRAVSAFKAPDLIAEALATCTGVPDSKLWSRRAKSFAECSSGRRPALLLVLDGLNERPTFDWRTLLESLQISPWKDQVATVLTCRPAFWREELSPALQISFQISEVGPYDDAELESALEKGGLQDTDLPTTLEPLLRRPRYLDLTVRHRRALEQSGDVTVDRLLYEDWKDRVSRKRGLFSDEDFRALLVQLAESHRDRLLLKREVQDLLPPGDTFLTGLDEIITGGILVRNSSSSGRYAVEPRRLVQGLGLLLADQVRNVSDQGEAAMKETMASFLEPHADIDRKVAICRFAATFAVFEPDFLEAAQFVLLEQWIGNRNLSREDVESFVAYLPASIGSYVRLVERFWTLRRTNRQAQSLLVRAFFRWRNNARVQQALIGACEKWFSYVHPYGYRFMRGRDDASRAELRREIEERAGCILRPGHKFLLVDELECIEDDNSLSLAEPALLLASLFPVAPFIPAFRRWALSRSVMGHPHEAATVALVLRWSGEDLWPALEAAVSPLLEGPRVAQQAAWRLLWACGREEAASVRKQLPRNLFPPSRYAETSAEDPCRSFWRREDCTMCAARHDLPDRLVALKLAPHALDPDFRIAPSLLPRLQRALSNIQAEQLSSRREMTAADNDFQRMEPTLAAFAPDLLADTYRSLVRGLPRRLEEGRQVLLWELDAMTLILGGKEWRVIRTAWDRACRPERWDDDAEDVENDLFAVLLFHLPAKAQLELLLSRPEETFDDFRFGQYFKRISADRARSLARGLLESKPRNLRRKLFYLSYQPAAPVVEVLGAERLVGLLVHKDQEVQEITRSWLFWSGSREVFDVAIEHGEVTPHWTQSMHQSWGGTLRIPTRSQLPYDTLARSIDLGSLSYVIHNRNRDLPSYIRDLDQALRSSATAEDETLKSSFSKETLRAITRRSPEVVDEWVNLAVDPGNKYLVRFCHMMLESLCEALLDTDPEKGGGLFHRLVDQRRHVGTVDNLLEVDVLALTLFRVSQSEHVESLLREWYTDCTKDKALFELALAASAVHNDERLSALIQQNLSSPVPVKKAAALALAGFAVHGMRAATLLESVEVHPEGWLHEIRKWARQHLERDRWGQEWFRRFVESPSTEESFAAFRLFLRCVDRRYWIWGNDILKRTRLKSGRRIYLAANRDRIEKAIKENEKELEKRFLGREIPEGKVHPWLERYLG